jgi:type IV secretion system protein VirD4
MARNKRGINTPAFGDAHFAMPPEMQHAALMGSHGIRLGYYRLPGNRKRLGQVIRYSGDGGLITIASARAGKARDVLVGALLDYRQSAIVVDPKGQLASVTAAERRRMGQEVIFLNPYNVWPDLLGPSARYNPMKLLDPSSRDWAADCRKLAEGLIAPNKSDGKAQHWIDGARGLLTGVIGALVAHGPADAQNLAHVREIICSDSLLLRFARASKRSPHAFIRQELSSYALKEPYNAGEISSFKQNARVQTFFLGLDTMADNLRGHDFTFAPLKEKPTTVYIILPENRLDVCSHWFRLVVASALDELWRGGKGKSRVLAILDEMAAIGHLDVLETAAATAAGRGVQLWPVYQNIPQIKKDYGEVWETFLSGSVMRMFLGDTRDQTTAEYVSKQAGTRTVITAGQSVHNGGPFGRNNESDNEGQTSQPLIRPHEVCGLGPNESIIFGPRNIVINAVRQPYFDTAEFQGLYDADPMHANDSAPPPAVRPETITTFADASAESEAQAEGARRARRPIALRLLTWGTSRNKILNALRKIEYLLTLPLRLLIALFAAPFALHNRPFGAALSLFALFGFWEVWDGVAKRPIVNLYQMKVQEYEAEARSQNRNSMGDELNSNYLAAKWLIGVPFRAMSGAREVESSQSGLNNNLDRAVAKASGALNSQTKALADEIDDVNETAVQKSLDESIRRSKIDNEAWLAELADRSR